MTPQERRRLRQMIEQHGFDHVLCIVAKDIGSIGIGHQLDFLKKLRRHVQEASWGWKRRSYHRPATNRLYEGVAKLEGERELQRAQGLKLIDIGYKALATELHPDKGGSNEVMAKLNRARDHLKKFV